VRPNGWDKRKRDWVRPDFERAELSWPSFSPLSMNGAAFDGEPARGSIDLEFGRYDAAREGKTVG